jgi:hypothetical protein
MDIAKNKMKETVEVRLLVLEQRALFTVIARMTRRVSLDLELRGLNPD